MAETDSRILEYLEEGLFLYGVGKVDDSIVRWRKVLELDPRNERAMDYIESAGGDVSEYRKRAAGGAAAPPQPKAQPQAAAAQTPPAMPQGPPPTPAPASRQVAAPTSPPAEPQAPQAAPAPAGESRDELVSKAEALYRAGYFEAALDLLEKIAREFPPADQALLGYIESTRTALLGALQSQWSRLDLVPRPRMGPGQIMQLRLSSEAGFILSRIDGMCNVEDVISACGLDQFTALRALNHLLQQGAIELTQPS